MCTTSEHTVAARSICLHRSLDHAKLDKGLRSAQRVPIPSSSITPDHHGRWQANTTRSAWHRAHEDEDGLLLPRSPHRVPATTSASGPLSAQARASGAIQQSRPIDSPRDQVVSQDARGTDAQDESISSIRLLNRRERRERREAMNDDHIEPTQNGGSRFGSMLAWFGGAKIWIKQRTSIYRSSSRSSRSSCSSRS